MLVLKILLHCLPLAFHMHTQYKNRQVVTVSILFHVLRLHVYLFAILRGRLQKAVKKTKLNLDVWLNSRHDLYCIFTVHLSSSDQQNLPSYVESSIWGGKTTTQQCFSLYIPCYIGLHIPGYFSCVWALGLLDVQASVSVSRLFLFMHSVCVVGCAPLHSVTFQLTKIITHALQSVRQLKVSACFAVDSGL